MLTRLYHRHIAVNPKLNYKILPFALFVKFLIKHLRDLPRQLLNIDLVRMLICLPRYILFYTILRRKKFSSVISSAVSKDTIEHNMRGVGELAAQRSHLLIRPIVCIDKVARNIRDLKVLSIGPRVEGEIYNLMGYGFKSKNIVGLDLFSYSKYIRVGDMHDMDFPDDSFDVVISGWVLGYSNDMQKCADEMRRVTKTGGIIAIGNAFHPITREEGAQQIGRLIGSEELIPNLGAVEKLFGVTYEDTYFRHDGARTGINGSPMVSVFEVRK